MAKLTPQLAQKIQDKAFDDMPSEKKIRLTSQLYLLLKKLQNSKIVTKNGTGRTVKKYS